MHILILAPFCTLPGEPGFNRFLYFAIQLSANHKVMLLTSSFQHAKKQQREKYISSNIPENLTVKLINEPGYKKNASIARAWSHHVFLNNFKKWFLDNAEVKKFDLIYSAYPLISTNIFLGENKNKFNYKLAIDIQDIWPESFSSVLSFLKSIPEQIIPFSRKANKAYNYADKIVAVSKTYLNRAKKINKRAEGMVVYIGSDFELIKKEQAKLLNSNKIHYLYMGTLSHSYDIKTMIDAFNEVGKNSDTYHLHIAGGGPNEGKLQQNIGSNITFHGFLEYQELISLAKGVDFFINPIKKYASQSVTNKISDYISLNKPIISSQECIEVKELINSLGGHHYIAGNKNSLINAIKIAAQSTKKNTLSLDGLDKMEMFNRKNTYLKLEDFITEKQ